MNTMRTKRVLWPLALVSAAFLFGCQEQASGPVGPEGSGILLNRDGPHPHRCCTFGVSFEGIVGGSGDLLGPHGGGNNLQNEHLMFVMITSTDFAGSVANAGNCFSGTPFLSNMQVSQVTPSNTNDAIIRFFFNARGINNERDIDYVLTVLATFDGVEAWPPPINKAETITGASFVLAHSNGPGRKVACTGEGDLNGEPFFTLTVTRTG